MSKESSWQSVISYFSNSVLSNRHYNPGNSSDKGVPRHLENYPITVQRNLLQGCLTKERSLWEHYKNRREVWENAWERRLHFRMSKRIAPLQMRRIIPVLRFCGKWSQGPWCQVWTCWLSFFLPFFFSFFYYFFLLLSSPYIWKKKVDSYGVVLDSDLLRERGS